MACGTERWPVKVVADRDAAQIVAIPVGSTIAQLGALPAPARPEQRRDTRWPGETTIYRVTATLSVIKREADGDLHLVMADDAGHTMIAESPDPSCASGSRFGVEIKDVRDALEAQFGSVRRARPNVSMTAIGVLFFDPCHGQEGRAPNNCVELHPLLSIEFGK